MTSSTDTLLQKINPEAAQKAAAAKAAKSKYPLINALRSDAFKKELALALPKTLTADRMARVLLTECRKNPALLDCELPSVQSCIMQAAQLGLEPGSALGHAYLIPFNTKKNGEWHKECQLIIGYRGMLDLCRRSGQIQSVNAYCVHEGDDFSYQLGLHPDIHHVPAATAKPGAMTYVYAVVQLKDGGTQFEVMSRAEIEAIRNNSQGYKQAVSNAQKWKSDIRSPWATNFEEMARKGLALDTRIPTPEGWTTMEALQKGDKVFDKDGKVTTVTSVSEVKHLPCFRVTFSNGYSVVCDNEHRWLARAGGGNAWRKPYTEMTVNEMYAAKDDGLSVTIPVQGALELPAAQLPIDPYLFGYWLGDGTSRSAQITCSTEDLSHVIKCIEKAGFVVGKIRHDYRSKAACVGIKHGLRKALLALNEIQNKHVPATFLRSSIEQRKALLAGLLDSDGTCEKQRGRAIFCSSKKHLRDAVFELACSLGETPNCRDFSVNLYEHGERKQFPAYSVEWQPSFNPFRLERKAALYRERKISKYLGVKSIEKIESVPTKCIAVDSTSRTYLCGDSMAITHNTVIRRMFKYLPMSIEAAQAVENDERADRGESPADFIDGIWSEKDEADISALEDLRDEAERIPEAVAAPAEKAPVKVAEPA